MQAYNLYHDISERTQGDVYIGVVGPVRTGKSTFISNFMEKVVIPGIENAHIRSRALDELPQSGSGRTIMTTQPVFVPNEAVDIVLPTNDHIHLRLIDSVGYLVEGALGTQEGESLRMVRTPWSSAEIPFERAAEIGTQKVIGEHSTIGLVITTDGTVTDLPRTAYIPAEHRVIEELKTLKKPFAVILNTQNPSAAKTQSLRKKMEEEYGVPVIAMNVAELNEEDIQQILKSVLEQFPLIQINIQFPEWLNALDEDHWLIKSMMQSLELSASHMPKVGDIKHFSAIIEENPYIQSISVRKVEHGTGNVFLQSTMPEGLFNQILAEQCGTQINSDAHLLSLLRELVNAKREYDRVANAIKAVRETGYGLVPPALEELSLQDPEIMKQGSRFGVRLRASAPSLHLIRVDIQTEVSPVVGTEQQSEEMIKYLMEGFDQDPQKIWESNLFGKPLADLVREGLFNKLIHMPADTQVKMQQTLEKIINEGSGGMVCILL